jgi:hypothetical protein
LALVRRFPIVCRFEVARRFAVVRRFAVARRFTDRRFFPDERDVAARFLRFAISSSCWWKFFNKENLPAKRVGSAPCRFVFLFVIAECFFEMPNYLGGLLEHIRKLQLIYLSYILSQTILYFPQGLLHFPDMVARATFSYTDHLKLLPLRPCKYQPLLTGDRSRIATRNGPL